MPFEYESTPGENPLKLEFGRGVRFYVAIPRNLDSAALKPESANRENRPEAARNGPVLGLGRLASPTRRFQAVRVQHASTRPNLSRIRGVGPK